MSIAEEIKVPLWIDAEMMPSVLRLTRDDEIPYFIKLITLMARKRTIPPIDDALRVELKIPLKDWDRFDAIARLVTHFVRLEDPEADLG